MGTYASVIGRRTFKLVGLLVAAAGLLVVARPSAEAQGPLPAPAACDERSWVAGSVDVCAGEVVYRDYIYDDRGANDGGFLPPIDPPLNAYCCIPGAGDQTYDAEQNTADLVALRIKLDGNQLRVSFELNTMFEPDQTIAALALDTDNNVATGGGAWPGLGVTSTGWEVLQKFTTGDPATNRIEGVITKPAGDHWRVQAVVAKADGTVMNVAFRGTDETGAWWENHQAGSLEAGDISGYGHVVDVADLTSNVTRTAPTPPGKVLQRVYTSDHPVPPGEGVDLEGVAGRGTSPVEFGGQRFHFLGKYQPYGFYLPDQPGPHGAQLLIHGYFENHSARLYFQVAPEHRITEHVGEARNRILAAPLGRGPAGWYSDWSERDVLDVLADVERVYEPEPGHEFVSGYSMGGYGAFRLGALHPDRFAGFITWVGHTGDVFNGVPPFQGQGGSAGAVGNVYEFVGNFRNLPGAMLFAGADELIHVSQAIAMGQQFQAQQVPHIWYLHPVAEHLTFAALDDWQKESDYTEDLALDHHPGRVTFRTDPTFGNAALGIAHDRAYWVSQIRNRGPGYADVDATTHGCGATLPVLEPTQGAGPAPVPWVSQGLAVVGHTPIPPGNELEATLTNVASVTIDVAGACLSTDAVNYRLATDGPVTLTLSDGRAVTVGAAGTHTGVLAAVAAAPDPAPAPTGPRTLPATGASAAVAAPLVLLALALIGRRCAS